MFENDKLKEIGGSPIYMAPETLISGNFSYASDIWALGCILYELCMLQSPFDFVNVSWFIILSMVFQKNLFSIIFSFFSILCWNIQKSMDELIEYTSSKLYKPIDTALMYSEELKYLCDMLLDPDASSRITINQIIASPFIMIQFYYSYFDI